MTNHPTRKNIRLPRAVYAGPRAFSVTVTTLGRHDSFADAGAVSLTLAALGESCTKHHFETLAYCFMPDHLHLLVSSADGTDLIAFMKHFKQLAGYRYKRRFARELWQKGYYDHILRVEEDISSAARYVFQNPVRAGIASDWRKFQFSGGRVFDALVGGGRAS